MTAIEVRQCFGIDGVARAAAEALVRQIDQAHRRRDVCYVAVSGGRAIDTMYRLLANSPREDIPWSRCDFFVTDECFPSDPRGTEPSRSDRLYDLLLREVCPGTDNLHRIPKNEVDLEAAALAYEEYIRRAIPGGEDNFPIIDVAVLELGSSGTLAGLDPGSRTQERERCVVAHKSGSDQRITTTAKLLSYARSMVILASDVGSAYRAAREEFSLAPHEAMTPGGRLRPSGTAFWFIDSATAEVSA